MLALISEGLKTREINKRASQFDPPYKVSRQQVDYYRDSRGVKLQEIVEASETGALMRGFALRETRVGALHELAEVLHRELCREGRLWLPQVKFIGTGAQAVRVDYEEFNRDEVNAFFKVLDELAKETGERAYGYAADEGEAEDGSQAAGAGGPELRIKVEYVGGNNADAADAARRANEDCEGSEPV
ncbi:MAG TPA: hypothetical protein VK422_01325 [Pyrinomonadaceae bacterium]|nr:hypothetical protein [Pyrinomonadaceae bacterium]